MSPISIASVSDEKYIYITTIGRRSGNPHTVELWFAASIGKIYLSHEGPYTDWMKNILKDSQVEFRIGNIKFKGKTRIVSEMETFEVGKHALYLKYYGKASQDVIDDWFSESTIIEITPLN